MDGETTKKPKYEASNRRFRKKRKGFQVKKEHETTSSENIVDFTLSYGVNIEEDVAVTSCSGSHVIIDTDVEVTDAGLRPRQWRPGVKSNPLHYSGF